MCLFYLLSAHTQKTLSDFISHLIACVAWPAFRNPNWNYRSRTHPMNSIPKSQQVYIVSASRISFTLPDRRCLGVLQCALIS